jgi:hypothetical protein
VDVGSIFSRTWMLYKRNFGWMILAGAIAAAVSFVISLITAAIAGTIASSAASNIAFVDGRFTFSSDSAVGAILGIIALLIGGVLVGQLFALILEGGMIKMGITSYRAGRSAQLSGLFDGFRHVGSFALFWLVTVAAIFGIFLLVFFVGATMGRVAILLGIAALVFLVWLFILWVYVIALITDHGLSCGKALSRSRQMVKRTGWWKTFLPLFVLGIVFFVILLVIGIAGVGVGNGTSRSVLQLIAEILLMPYTICFLASMYVGAEELGSPATSADYAAPPSPPAPPRPFGQPSPPAPPRPASPMEERAAWAAAADPLASAPQVASPPADKATPVAAPSFVDRFAAPVASPVASTPFVDPFAAMSRTPETSPATPPAPPKALPAVAEEPTT